jgi:starch phosphorylase
MLYDSLLQENDQFFILKDFASYIGAWNRLYSLYEDKYKWFNSSLVNIAKAGKFSSDFSIKNYAKEIWRTKYNERAK